jgi:hypothetical protein
VSQETVEEAREWLELKRDAMGKIISLRMDEAAAIVDDYAAGKIGSWSDFEIKWNEHNRRWAFMDFGPDHPRNRSPHQKSEQAR